MRYEGHNGVIEVDGDALVVTRSGLAAKAAYGRNVPPRRIPLEAVSGVRFKAAGRLANGWLQLQLGGVDKPLPTATTAAGDPDVIVFTYGKRVSFEQLHAWLESVVAHNLESGVDPSTVQFDAGEARMDRLEERKAAALNKRDGIEHVTGSAREARQEARDAEGVLFEGISHDSGRNAQVTLYRDRLTRVQEAKLTSFSSARQDTEVTPVKAVSSVQAKKDGLMYTKVTVYASGNNIEFRFGHEEAQRFKDALMSLVLDGGGTGPVAPSSTPVAGPDLADQLSKLAALRDQGVLTEDEFTAKKAQILARI